MAMPAIGGQPMRGITGTSVNAERIVATLNIAGDSAGMKKRRSEFSMPIIATPPRPSSRNGSMMRVSRTCQRELAGDRRVFRREGARERRRERASPPTTQISVTSGQRVDDVIAEPPRMLARRAELCG